MAGPMAGIRVVELGLWVAGPSASGILADWGADVIKIEPPAGDPFRGLYLSVTGHHMPACPPFELDNRGKRSICLALDTAEGRAIALELVAGADVFVTNARFPALARAGLDWEQLAQHHPRLVYARLSGYGETGPDRDRPAYDVGAFWARAGVVAALTPPGGEPPYQRGAFGDHMTGMTAAGGIAAALLARERTGRGQLVSTSLLRVGIFTMGWDMSAYVRLGIPTVPMTHNTMPNPVISAYRSGDGKWFWLLGLQGDRHWPDLVAAIDRPEWLTDPRFSSIRARGEHVGELVPMLDAIFATKTRAEWTAIFDRVGMWWAPVQDTAEVAADPQAIASGAFVDVPLAEGGTGRSVATPVDFSDTRWAPAGPVPECGQHTEEILLELGHDWEDIGRLKEQKAIP